MGAFKLVRVMMGSDWPSGHVAIDEFITYPGKAGGKERLITPDASEAWHLNAYIDELIAELEAIKKIAPEKFAQWQELVK